MDNFKLNRVIIATIIMLSCNGLSQDIEDGISQDSSSIMLQVIGSGGNSNDSFSNITLTKTISGSGSRLAYNYAIDTPKVDDFDFVLALDSSGSMGDVGEPEQGKAVADAIPRFIKETIEKKSDKNFKISIVSWDDDIDFAYGNDFNNTNPKIAKLVPIKKADEDIKNQLVFGEESGKEYFYKSSPREHTNISKAIEASIDIFKNNEPNYANRTSRFIILVVGESEYDPCNKDLIQKAEKEGYSIYVIGMPFNEKNEMLDHLSRDICFNNSDRRRLQTVSSPTIELKDALFTALIQALENATTEPAANDVRIIETFSSNLPPVGEISAKIDEGSSTPIDNITTRRDNKTGSYELEFMLPFGLYPETTTFVTLYSGLELEMPMQSMANQSKQSAKFSYRWLNKFPREISIPETRFRLESIPLTTTSVSEEDKIGVDQPTKANGNGLSPAALFSFLNYFGNLYL